MPNKWHNSSMAGEYETQSLPPVEIGEDDSFEPTVEQLVSASKVAVEIDDGQRKHHAPNEFVLNVKVLPQHAKRLKVIARRAGGRWFITLVTEQMEILRDYHFNYAEHGNPDDTVVGRSHKHFPSRKYPLRKSHKGIETWAYDPGPFPQDFVQAVKHFCKECNITIEGLQERFPLRWFR